MSRAEARQSKNMEDVIRVARAIPAQLIHPRVLADAVERDRERRRRNIKSGDEHPTGQGAAEGIASRASYVAIKSANNRKRYNEFVSQLDPDDTAGRSRIKGELRTRDPIEVRQRIAKDRPELGPRPGSGGTANQIGRAHV